MVRIEEVPQHQDDAVLPEVANDQSGVASSEELILLVLQLLGDEERFAPVVTALKKECRGVHFNLKDVEDLVLAGKWDETDKYLSAFGNSENCRIMRVKILEGMVADLSAKPSSSHDKQAVRTHLFSNLKRLAEDDVVLRSKLAFPTLSAARMKAIIDQRMKHSIQSVAASGEILTVTAPVVDTDATRTKRNAAHSKQETWKRLEFPDTLKSGKVLRLMYTRCEAIHGLIAISSTAIYKLWNWKSIVQDSSEVTYEELHKIEWKVRDAKVMSVDARDCNLAEVTVACMALSKDANLLAVASGGAISLISIDSVAKLPYAWTNFMDPPPAATCVAFHPLRNNIVAIGREDASIVIFDYLQKKEIVKINGHKQRLTCLAFSHTSKLMVSSSADAKVCTWDTKKWCTRKSVALQVQPGRTGPVKGDTKVEFDTKRSHYRILAVHESQIVIFNKKLNALHAWAPEIGRFITSATFSSDGDHVYIGICDGEISIFATQGLKIINRLMPASPLRTIAVYPTVIASNPKECNQIAVGYSDGTTHLLLLTPLKDRQLRIRIKNMPARL